MTGLVVLLAEFVAWCLARLGPRRAIALGRAFGSFAYYCIPVRKRIVRENLLHAFPEKSEAERKAIAHATYRHLGRILIEVLMVPKLSNEQIHGMVRMRNVEVLDGALAQGKGVIACMAHMGNWELLGHAGFERGYRIYAVTKVLKGKLNERLHAMRKQVFRELPPSGSFQRGLDALKENAALALLIDQHRSGDKAVVVDFFHRPAATSPSPALFALRSGAPVITAWMTLGEDDVYDVHLAGPFPVPDAPTVAEQLQRHTQLIADDLERMIRQHPGDWYWVHRRWKVKAAPKPEEAAAPALSP